MVKFPDGLGWGKVTGRFVNGLADSFDEGDAPDLEGAKGVEDGKGISFSDGDAFELTAQILDVPTLQKELQDG